MSNQTTADNGTCFKCTRPLGAVVICVGSERFHEACAPGALLTPGEDDEKTAREIAVEFDACFAGTPEQHAKIQDGLVKAIAQALAARDAAARARQRQLIYDDLGKLKWIGSDPGWDLAIEKVRECLANGKIP